jgi:hypothetical protein
MGMMVVCPFLPFYHFLMQLLLATTSKCSVGKESVTLLSLSVLFQFVKALQYIVYVKLIVEICQLSEQRGPAVFCLFLPIMLNFNFNIQIPK